MYRVNGSEIEVTYRYTDIYIISAISLGLLKRGKPTVNVAKTARQNLPKGKANQKLEIKKGLFVEASTPGHLLCLLGMENAVKRNWQARVRALASEEWGPKGETHASKLDEYRRELPAIMTEVCGHAKP